ncbi:MAG: hypothetical protein KME45_10570 [Stenomitos rutilans HA7619-LM2]|jgi:hypothetical protein|nr:hypothetical protein [Stenomitos rutilans HA7619-LM2]
MNLPLLLDIGIGLFVIYVTFSLLASEFQELLTTLLQWRAQHLKQSIETLLAGESKPELGQSAAEIQQIQTQLKASKELADRLYNHALIRSLEHESKGLLGSIAERVSQWTSASKTFAGKASGPSYLPSETFSTALLETLKIGALTQAITQRKFIQLIVTKVVQPIFDVISALRHHNANELLLEPELQAFQTEIKAIEQTLSHQPELDSIPLSQVAGVVNRLLTNVKAVLPESDPLSQGYVQQLTAIEQQVSTLEKEAEPNFIEVMSSFKTLTWVAQSLQPSNNFDQAMLDQIPDSALQQRFQAGYDLLQATKQVIKVADQGQDDFQAMLTQLSPHLRDSLEMLAKRAQTKIPPFEQGTNQLAQEVAIWFDRSMERSAGVYKRNAKGVAMLIGLVIAVTTNTDTLHIINRLAQDSALRAAYSQAASTLVSTNPNAIVCLQAQTDQASQIACLNNNAVNLRVALDRTTALPIGWNATNWQEQWQLHPQGRLIASLKLLIGWLVSAIALSMGAPFWFNVLNKIVNVRNSGKPPASTS